MPRYVLLSGFLVFLALPLHASAPSHLFSQRFGGTNSDSIRQIALDGAGNIYVFGEFAGTTNVGGSGLNSAGQLDVFVAKYTPAGSHLWSERFGGSGFDYTTAMAVDGSGNVHICGGFSGTVNFGGSDLAGGSGGGFLAKYDTDGSHQWSHAFPGAQGRALGVDPFGFVTMGGQFNGTVDFGGGPLTAYGSSGNSDAFLAKFDGSGNHVWSHRFGGEDIDAFESIAVGAALNTYVVGVFRGTSDFGGASMLSAGNYDMVLANYDFAGNHQWSEQLGGAGDELFPKLALGIGPLFLAGYYDGTTNLGGGNLASAGLNDAFLAAYGTDGTHLWSQRMGGTGYDAAYSVAADASGNAYMTGYFELAVNFGGTPLNSVGNTDAFMAKYDALGGHLWSVRFGGGNWDDGESLVVDGAGGIVLGGGFNDTANFGGTDLTSVGEWDIVLARYSDAPTTGVGGGVPPVARRLSVYPNPSGGAQHIGLLGEPDTKDSADFDIYDAGGRLVWTDAGVRSHERLSMVWTGIDMEGRAVPSGVYFVTGRTRSGASVTAKLIRLK